MIDDGEVAELLALEGEARGAALLTDAAWVRKRFGEDGLARVEAELARLGQPIAYDQVRAMAWIPLGQRFLSAVVIREVFGLEREDIVEMGAAAPQTSFIVAMLMRFFLSPRAALERAELNWTRHYTVGRLRVVEVDEGVGRALVHVEDYRIHPLQGAYFTGYLRRYWEMLFATDHVTVEETRSMFRGDPVNAYAVTWSAR